MLLASAGSGPLAMADPPAATTRPSPPPSRPEAEEPSLDEGLARGCIAAAWRASGLGEDDARIDSMLARASASALLPEISMRAMELWSDASHTSTVTTSDSTTLYDALGTHLVLEVRLAWKLDCFLYVGDEAALERIRLERHEARSRLASKTLDALFAWVRARVDAGEALAGSREALEARLRVAEARATLDVLTGGGSLAPLLDRRGAHRYGSLPALPCSAKRERSLPTSNGASWR